MRNQYKILALIASSSVISSIANADVPPARKTGLWETTVQMDQGLPNHTMKECVDSSTDAEMMKMATETSKTMGGGCSKQELTRTSTGFTSESVCELNGSSVTSKGVFTGDFTSEYKGEVTTTYNPPMFGSSGSKTTVSSKYLGACAADMKPGDIIMANGIKSNIKESVARAEKLAKMMKNGGGLGQGMAAAQGQMKPEDLKAMQEAMKQLESMGE